MPRMNMDINREKQTSKGDGGGVYVKELFRPLPTQDGKKANNKLLFLLFEPYRWRMFNPTQEMAQKYNLAYNNGGLVSVRPDLCTFYWKLPYHGVDNFKRPDGSEGYTYLVCPKGMNQYLQTYNFDPLFLDDSCPYCDEAQKYWDIFGNRFAELGYDQDAKKALSTDQYRSLVDGDSVLKMARQSARNNQTQERYLLNVFDHSKFIGERPLDKEQSSVEHQLWIAPKKIFDDLIKIYEAEVEFYETEKSSELCVVSVTKDNSKGRTRSEYSTTFSGKRHLYPQEWLAYINDMSARVDPTAFISLATRQEMQYYLGNSDKPQAQMQPPRNPPPMQPPAQQAQPQAPQLPVQPPAQPQVQPPQVAPAMSPVPPPAVASPRPPAMSPLPNVPSGPANPGRPPQMPGESPNVPAGPNRTAPAGGPPPLKMNWK